MITITLQPIAINKSSLRDEWGFLSPCLIADAGNQRFRDFITIAMSHPDDITFNYTFILPAFYRIS